MKLIESLRNAQKEQPSGGELVTKSSSEEILALTGYEISDKVPVLTFFWDGSADNVFPTYVNLVHGSAMEELDEEIHVLMRF
jgi:hypothetical protein